MRTLCRDRYAFRPTLDGLSKRIAPCTVIGPCSTSTTTTFAPLDTTTTTVTAINTSGLPTTSTSTTLD